MKTDPVDERTITAISRPPSRGPGSGKDAWIAFAEELSEANRNWNALAEEQSAVIRELKAEIALLREQIAARKPEGSRQRLADDKVARIEAAIGEGLSTRAVAQRF